ncbi:MAG: hypothetical protein WBL25_02040, partial [Anaerolineales bacterium]
PLSIQNQQSEIENAVFGALDLCLACKGCKAECPSGVDMAKLKYEFQHEYYQSHRRKLRDYLFAYIGPLTQIGAPFGRFANWMLSKNVIRKIINPFFGLALQRGLPKFGVRENYPSFWRLLRRQRTAPRKDTMETVLLLCDTFTHFFEPEIEKAALEVLSACGINVIFLPYFGAGRTLISKGFIEPARQHAKRILDAIDKLDPDKKIPVLGIEPSELYTLREEFLDLLPNRRKEVEELAKRVWLVEEFLVRPQKNDNNNELRVTKIVRESPYWDTQKIKLHGHCYQKAQPPAADGFAVGQAASAALLLAMGYEVEIIPSGCCGMAGAFGYEAEHYNVSMQVGELTLFPAVRIATKNGNLVSAVGTSCRSQILDGADTHAKHPIQMVAERLHKIEASRAFE